MLSFVSHAPATANAVLAIEFTMGAALIAGTMLARRKRFKAHAICQTSVVLLNLIIIFAFMVPSFHTAVLPGILAHPTRSYYLLATMHGILGVIAELFGIYVVLVAGTKLLPQWLRFTRYKLWMRAALIFWWLDLLLGLAVYARWYLRWQ